MSVLPWVCVLASIFLCAMAVQWLPYSIAVRCPNTNVVFCLFACCSTLTHRQLEAVGHCWSGRTRSGLEESKIASLAKHKFLFVMHTRRQLCAEIRSLLVIGWLVMLSMLTSTTMVASSNDHDQTYKLMGLSRCLPVYLSVCLPACLTNRVNLKSIRSRSNRPLIMTAVMVVQASIHPFIPFLPLHSLVRETLIRFIANQAGNWHWK